MIHVYVCIDIYVCVRIYVHAYACVQMHRK